MIRVLITIVLAVVLLFPSPALAQGKVISSFPDQLLKTTFNELPAFNEGGEVSSVGNLAEDLGYDPARIWDAGTAVSDVVKVGDIDTGLAASDLSLEQIAQITGLDISALPIASLEFLRGVSFAEFIKDIPFLEDWNLSDLPDLAGLLGESETLGALIANNVELAQLEALDVLGALPIAAIPNLDLAALSDFAGVGDAVISNVPGLGDIPFGSFPIPIGVPSVNFFPKQDIAFEESEYSGAQPTPDPVSGGTNGTSTWQPLACEGGCAHIELHDTGWEGASWMTKAHRVKDGWGLLGGLFSEAGAYRLPFGDSFALQVTSTDEQAGTAEWGLAFRVCSRGLFDLGCSAYFMEVPLGITTREGDNVLTGIRDGKGGASIPIEPPPGYEALRPDIPPELASVIAANTLGGGSRAGASLCGDGPGGVKFEALGEAYHQIESRGSGDYGAVGVWVNLSGQETGRAFGRYQYMSYRADVIRAVSQQAGGSTLLQKARNPNASIGADELLSVFPPDVQDGLFVEDQTYMINLALAKGYAGDRLLEVLAQMHFRGPGVLNSRQLDSQTTTDSLGTSLYEYGQRFRQYYRAAEAKLAGGDEETRCKASGSFINPIEDGSGYFTRRFNPNPSPHPVTGRSRRHDGDDIGVGVGTAVVASDGGVVEHYTEGNGNKGYGWALIINHGNGTETLYAHLSERLAAQGARVAQGDVIARSGGARGAKGSGTSSGPHLHFEVIVNGRPEAPANHVDYSRTAADVR